MSRLICVATGLLAAGALVVPIAEAAPPTAEELKAQLDSIPDPGTVSGAPVATAPSDVVVDVPSTVEPADPAGDDEDPFEPTPTVVATPEATSTVAPPTVDPAPAAAIETPVVSEAPRTVAPEPSSMVNPPAEPVATASPPAGPLPRSVPKTLIAIPEHLDRFHSRPAISPRRSRRSRPSRAAAAAPRVQARRGKEGSLRLHGRMHIVRPGECLSVIAPRYGLSWPQLAAINHVPGPDYVIYAGQVLAVDQPDSTR